MNDGKPNWPRNVNCAFKITMEERVLLRHRARRLKVTEAVIHRTEAFDVAIEDERGWVKREEW